MERYTQRVLMETDRHRIVGSITLPTEGYRSRLSDFLNSADRNFIAVTDALIEPLDGSREPVGVSFVAVSRSHIVVAMLHEEHAAAEAAGRARGDDQAPPAAA